MAYDQDTELWDAYYPDGTLAGCDLIRGQEIPQGLRHVVAEVFVMHQDGDILLMQRDFDKPNDPGCWESTAGGSVLKGERVIDGARRELLEETGIAADDALECLYHMVSDTSIYQGYLYVTDISKENVKLQKGETIAFRWVDQQEFKKIFHSDQYVGGLKERLQEFVDNDFVPVLGKTAK
ncbi:MAG: NUDIX domain-containing protein [Eubacterium sp.]|nr:NUDIX domain-containing protein [Eubacterium sp.]